MLNWGMGAGVNRLAGLISLCGGWLLWITCIPIIRRCVGRNGARTRMSSQGYGVPRCHVPLLAYRMCVAVAHIPPLPTPRIPCVPATHVDNKISWFCGGQLLLSRRTAHVARAKTQVLRLPDCMPKPTPATPHHTLTHP